MPGHDILFVGAVDWFGARKLPAHHVSELLARSNRVFYVDNFGGSRPLTLRDLPRAARKLRQMAGGERRQSPGGGGGGAASGSGGGVVVHQPVGVPLPSLPALADPLNTALFTRGLRRLMRRHGIERPVIWTRLPSPVMWNALQRIPHALLVYQSVDHFPYSPAIPEALRPRLAVSERRICEAADLVFTSARGLYDLKRQVNPRTHLFVNGVHTEPFAAPGPRVPRLEGMPRPVIGFAGGLGSWVDFALVRDAARLTPEWSWVMLGKPSPGVDLGGIEAVPNVHLLGEVPHGDLPAWFRSFDAGIIPYRLTEFTRYTFPSKMAEYLAAGLPVASTSLTELEPYAGVIRFADDPAALVQALREELERPDAGAACRARRDVAASLRWDAIVDRMEARIDEALEARAGHGTDSPARGAS